LDFQLSEHEKFLYDFTQLFKQVDNDRNGIINEDEFRDLLSQMKVLHKDEELIVLL
jgi:Ca2+-binding EF-hand superfamily protein